MKLFQTRLVLVNEGLTAEPSSRSSERRVGHESKRANSAIPHIPGEVGGMLDSEFLHRLLTQPVFLEVLMPLRVLQMPCVGRKEDSLQSRMTCFTTLLCLHRAWVQSSRRILLTNLERPSQTRAALEDVVSIPCMLHPLGMLSDSEVPGDVPSVPLPLVLWPFLCCC